MKTWTKVPSWVERLNFYILEHQWEPYEWGKQDCVLFTLNAVLAMTGRDPIPEYRAEPWKTKEQAMAMLEAEGGLIAGMDKRFDRRGHLEFSRGDPVLTRDAEGEPSLGICAGRSIAVAGFEEVLYMPMSQQNAPIVWRLD
jgi:hypothetical protein